jgi:hypothetical protein
VVLRRNDRLLGVANGDRGTVAAVDTDARTLDVELPGRRVRLDAGYLDSAARHAPALQHAYAITGHVAQGLTFGQTFVLATDLISREWIYSALSRGGESNRLYAVSDRTSERDEYAPGDSRPRGAREQLAAAVERSEAHALASDTGREPHLLGELRHATAELAAAVRAHDAAARVGARLEAASPHPLRRRACRQHRRDLTRARDAEVRALRHADLWRAREGVARAQLDQERRLRAGERSRQRTDELRPARDRTQAQHLGLERPDRVLDRAADAGRGLGR